MSEKLKLFLEELFLILASIIGMGFASGKEIENFFCFSKPLAFFSVIVFILFYAILFSKIFKIKSKHNISNFEQLNKVLFKDFYKFVNIILIIIYVITSSAMIAGLDELMKTIFNIKFPICSIILSVIVFFVVSGGIGRIQNIFLKFVPLLLLLIFINLFVNVWNLPSFQLSFNINVNSLLCSFIFPLLFLGGNFILIIEILLQNKSNPKLLKWGSIFIFFIFILLAVLVVVFMNINSTMPFLSASKNLSNVFYYLYVLAIIIALLSTLVVSVFNVWNLTKEKTKFELLIISLTCQILSFVGFDFIVKYLYSFSGILGLVYCTVLLFKLK